MAKDLGFGQDREGQARTGDSTDMNDGDGDESEEVEEARKIYKK